MKPEEILQVLKDAANFEMEHKDIGWCGHGAINNFPECKVLGGMTRYEYNRHYYKNKTLLESLPWSKVVENPRRPRADEYPAEDGEYITMLDCNEHEVLTNRFRDGNWLVYNRTHVKWWMPIPVVNN